MTLRQFISAYKTDIDSVIQYANTFVPRTASCFCHRNGTDHHHTDNVHSINNEERRQWILNDEGLYRWARREGVKI